MKTILLVGLVAALATVAMAQEPPKPAPPAKEHDWLKHLTGEWDADMSCVMEPGKPPMKSKATSSGKMLGGLWLNSEMKILEGGTPVMTAVLTLGYDPAKKKYIGTWVDSMTTHMWKYEGSLDEAGKVLTLNADGPNMQDPTKTAKYKDVYEVKGPDHHVLTSQYQGDDGKWVQFMTAEFKRRK